MNNVTGLLISVKKLNEERKNIPHFQVASTGNERRYKRALSEILIKNHELNVTNDETDFTDK